MEFSHKTIASFEKPRVGKTYSSLQYGSVRISEIPANNLNRFEDCSDSVKYSLAIGAVGMGGASLLDKQVLSWDTYVDLDEKMKKVAISSHKILVKPPKKWSLALQVALSSYIFPESSGFKTLMYDFDEVLWELEDYHSLASEARYPKDFDSDVFKKFKNAISVQEPQPGEIYLNSYGDACIYSQISSTKEKNCTEFKLSNVKPVTIDISKTYIIPPHKEKTLSNETYDKLERRADIWIQTSKTDDKFNKRIETAYDTIINPNSLTARLGKLQQWMNFRISTNQKTVSLTIANKLGLQLSNTTSEKIEKKENSIKYQIETKIMIVQNKILDKLKDITRKYNL
jgi:hypothetical protein